MRQITINIPEGYVWKVVGVVLVGAALLAAAPYYGNYLERVSAQTKIEQAKAVAEAKRILGECKE